MAEMLPGTICWRKTAVTLLERESSTDLQVNSSQLTNGDNDGGNEIGVLGLND